MSPNEIGILFEGLEERLLTIEFFIIANDYQAANHELQKFIEYMYILQGNLEREIKKENLCHNKSGKFKLFKT